jgi:hypothetical protein
MLFASVIPFSAPDIFVYKSAHAAATPAIPDWIQSTCCGPEDVHHLTAAQVQRNDDGTYQVDGYRQPIPAARAQPSQDSDYWIFYRDTASSTGGDSSQSGVYCFFIPMNF